MNTRTRPTPFLLGTAVGNGDTARVAIVADPTFDETTVIGKVFDDQDGDGWQDEGENGIPGVRLATVEGLVAETDAFGRYHFAALDGGFMERGRNFIVKLDPTTLPPGSTVETENPKVARITPGMLGRFDFGVKLARLDVPAKRIDLKLAELYFGRDSAELSTEYLPLLTELADRIRRGEKAKVTVKVSPPSPEGCTPACQLGRRRIDAVRRALMRLLGPEGLRNVEVVADYTAAGGVAFNDRLGALGARSRLRRRVGADPGRAGRAVPGEHLRDPAGRGAREVRTRAGRSGPLLGDGRRHRGRSAARGRGAGPAAGGERAGRRQGARSRSTRTTRCSSRSTRWSCTAATTATARRRWRSCRCASCRTRCATC